MSDPLDGQPAQQEAPSRSLIGYLPTTLPAVYLGPVDLEALLDEATASLRSLGEKCDGWQQRAERSEDRLARIEAVLREWGVLSGDGGPASDPGFAEAIGDSGAWRLARDLRTAVAGSATD